MAGGFAKALANLSGLAAPKESLEQIKKKVDGEFRKLGRRIIVVVDDVDRLTQVQIRQLFQTIKLNANFPNTVYLVAADRSVVEKSLDYRTRSFGQGLLGEDRSSGLRCASTRSCPHFRTTP